MATSSSFASLSRRAKRGTVATAGDVMPPAGGVIGAVEDPGSGSAAVAAADASGGENASSDAHEVTGADLVVGGDILDFLGEVSAEDPVTASREAARRAPLDPAAGVEGLAQKVSVPGSSAFSALTRRASAKEPAAAPRDYDSGAKGAFSSLVKPGDETGTRAARRDVNAIKLVTRLVRAIAFKPGTTADRRVKSEKLRTMLTEVSRAATEVAIAAAPLDAHRGWVQAMSTEAMGELVASRVEQDAFGEQVNLDEAIELIKQIFESSERDAAIAQAIAPMRDAAYVEADSAAVARDRVRVSFGAACWELYEAVTHPRLGVDAFRYTYDRKPDEIVARLSDEVLRIARESNITGVSADMRTAHLQGSIRRLAQLMGSEYVNRTSQIVNWIREAPDDDEFGRRAKEAEKALDKQVIPEVVELARRNFLDIEQIAPRLLEESKHADEQVPRHGG